MREKNGFRKAERFKDIKEIIYNSAKLYGDKIAFTTKVKNGENIEYIDHTYTDLLDDINSFGTALYGMDLEDSRVAVIGVNCYKWAVAHLSNLLGGIVSVPLDKGLQQEELEDSLIRSEAKAIVFDAKLTEIISKIKENGKTKIEHYICMDATDEFTSFDKLLVEGKKKRENGTALSSALSVTILRILFTFILVLVPRIIKNAQDKKKGRIKDEADRKEQERRESMGKWK